VIERFTSYPGAVRVEAAGRSRGAIVLGCGMHVDLRVLPRRSFGAALHYFTGSKAHNIAVRRLGVEHGLRISEYGVFRLPKTGSGAGRRIGGETEEEVFAAVGMDWVPPELREDRGEIAAALEHRLPALVELADIRGDLQMHTEWSDGRATIEEMALACEARGYAYMAITDHSASATIARGLTARDLAAQCREVARVRRRVPGIRILHGLEVDIRRDGSLDLADEWLARLDLIVISVHSAMGMERDAMTRRVLRALAHPAVHILAHPTGRLIGEREPIAIDMEAVFRAAAQAGVAVEVNAQPDRLDLDDVLVRRARELGARIAIDSDAHSADTLRFMRHGVDQARRGWIEAADVVNTWTRARLERWLSAGRALRKPSRRPRPRRRTARLIRRAAG
jgi:DNA polymerase (family 10)